MRHIWVGGNLMIQIVEWQMGPPHPKPKAQDWFKTITLKVAVPSCFACLFRTIALNWCGLALVFAFIFCSEAHWVCFPQNPLYYSTPVRVTHWTKEELHRDRQIPKRSREGMCCSQVSYFKFYLLYTQTVSVCSEIHFPPASLIVFHITVLSTKTNGINGYHSFLI